MSEDLDEQAERLDMHNTCYHTDEQIRELVADLRKYRAALDAGVKPKPEKTTLDGKVVGPTIMDGLIGDEPKTKFVRRF